MKTNLITEYKQLGAICAKTEYGDELSVRTHNQSVNRMHEIVDSIAAQQDAEKLEQFVELLAISEHKVNLWAAIHTLERLSVDFETQANALQIIHEAAQDYGPEALGYQSWLDNWYEHNGTS
ncbi:hypothetical protein [Pontibacter sp. G13]|uniref:hypothetical protein n=1 Tax=Pontibacter sp. G13 TaxID=3074898 RepID=UPI00288B05ED|nr:hypothetical protein [Pontibacter sp. G13]WNJ18259.1 hypothetical protein RJD25_25690 [Pontibacter sp. G13]